MQSRQQRKHSRIFLILAYITLAWAIPTIISIGRLLSSAGSSAFVFPKFMDFVNSWGHHPNSTMASQNHTMPGMQPTHGCDAPGGQQECMSTIAISVALFSVICNVIVNLFTRIPAIFAEFRSHYRNLKNHNNPLPLEETNTRETTHYFDFKGMSFSSGTIYAALKSVNLASGGFVALSTYLSIKSLGEFLEQCVLHTTVAENNPAGRAAFYEAMALLFAATSFANYFIYNVRSGDKNAKTFATNIVQGKLVPFDRTLLATIASASPATICVGPMAFFTTFHALQKICWLNIPARARYAIAGTSFATASMGRILTDIPAMYALMKTRFNPEQHQNKKYTSCMVTPYKGVVYTAGLGDSAGTAVTNFTGFINTAEMVLKIQQNNPGLIASAALCAASSGALNFAFGVHNGVNKSLRLFFKPASEPRYQRLPTSIEEANNDSNDSNDSAVIIDASAAQDVETGLLFDKETFKPVSKTVSNSASIYMAA